MLTLFSLKVTEMRYAVKIKNNWFIATKELESNYGFPYSGRLNENADAYVWAEEGTTALLCSVGNEEKCIELD